MKNKKMLVLILTSLVAISCKSIPSGDSDYLYVMIYDYENNGIKDVSLLIDSKEIGKSDINGRFMIPIKEKDGKHSITLKKNDYETISDEIELRPDIVLYYKMGTSDYYFETAEMLLDENEVNSSLASINKAIEIKSKDEYLFFKAVILQRLGEKEKAGEALKEINSEQSNHYVKEMEEYYEK